MKVLKIAVTGSAGSGKSHVCNCFKKLGAATMDCDVIARQVVDPGEQGFVKVVELFGANVVQKDGALDRAKLRTLIINDSDSRRQMEDILHPQILNRMMVQMEACRKKGFRMVVVEVPLLFESGMEQFFDVTIAVVGSDADLAKRIAARDGVTVGQAKKMLRLQMPQAEKMKKADHVVENKASLTELFESVANLYEKFEKEFLTT